MGINERVLNEKIEVLRRELNESIQGKENLIGLYYKSVQLDKLIEEYIRCEKTPASISGE